MKELLVGQNGNKKTVDWFTWLGGTKYRVVKGITWISGTMSVFYEKKNPFNVFVTTSIRDAYSSGGLNVNVTTSIRDAYSSGGLGVNVTTSIRNYP